MSDLAMQFLHDNSGESIAVKHVQDVEPVLEYNKAMRAEHQHSDWGRQIAEIPNVIYMRWFNEEQARGNTSLRMFSKEFDEIVARKLKDPDWAYLRTDKPALIINGFMGFGS